MEYFERKRPMLASVICVVTVLVSVQMLLRTMHLMPALPSRFQPRDHLALHEALRVIEPVLNILGAAYLWRMRHVAWVLFAVEAFVVMLAGLYLGYISPSGHMRDLIAVHHETAVYACSLIFELALTIYVWRITTTPQASARRRIRSHVV
jgi:hypothetical protein